MESNAVCPCIVTGGNTGMGYATALAIAIVGHSVIIACRSAEKGQQAAQLITTECVQQGSQGTAECIPLDLASLASVRQFAQVVCDRYPGVQTLICNAGIMNPPYRLTEDGFESQFQVNYLGHFLLTNLLMDALLRSKRPRLISISSLSSEKATCNTAEEFIALGRCSADDYVPITSYRESKLAQVIFTAEAHRRYHALGLTTSAVHPGVVNTDLFYRALPGWTKQILSPVIWLGYRSGRLRTPSQGAATAIYLATQPNGVMGGQYWADLKEPRTPNIRMQDEQLGKELWNSSAKLVGIAESGRAATA